LFFFFVNFITPQFINAVYVSKIIIAFPRTFGTLAEEKTEVCFVLRFRFWTSNRRSLSHSLTTCPLVVFLSTDTTVPQLQTATPFPVCINVHRICFVLLQLRDICRERKAKEEKKRAGNLKSKLKYFSLVTSAQTRRFRDTACYFNKCVTIHKVFFVSQHTHVVIIT